MAATYANSSALLKEIYEPRVRKQLNDDVVALKRIEKSSEGVRNDVGGRYVTFAVHTKRNQGIGARAEMELLPRPGKQGNAAARVGLKYQYGSIGLTGQAMKLAEHDYQSFASVLDQEVTRIRDDLAVDLNRQVYGNGSGTFTTLSPSTGGTLTAQNVLWLQEDMRVDIIRGITGGSPTVVASDRVISGITPTTGTAGTVTISGANPTVQSGDVIVRHGNMNREWTGFGAIIQDSGTLYNISPTTEPVWKAHVDAPGAARPLSEGLMINMVDRIRTSGSKPTVIFTSLGVRRAYFALLSQQRQYVNTQEFEGGFKGLAFTTDNGDVPLISDIMCPQGDMLFVNEKEIKLYREADWAWMDEDGSKWVRTQGYDAYEATLFQYSELGTHRRNSHGRMTNIQEA